MFRPRSHGSVREKALLRRARWSTIGAFAIATCMHWTGGCASTGERWDDAVVESDETLPESGLGNKTTGVLLADEGSDAFRPEPLSDEPRTGRGTRLAAAGPVGTGKHDAAIMDLDASLPSDAAPLLVPSGKSSPLAMKLDEEKMKKEEAERAAIVADNDRLLAEATASLVAKPKAKATHVARHHAKKAPRKAHYAKHKHASKKARLVASHQATPVVPPIERWKPTAPPIVASTETKPVAPVTAPAAPAAVAVASAPEAPKTLAAAAPTAPKPPTTVVDKKTQPKLASVQMGDAFARHVGLLLMGLGTLVLLCLFFLRKSRRENEPMDW